MVGSTSEMYPVIAEGSGAGGRPATRADASVSIHSGNIHPSFFLAVLRGVGRKPLEWVKIAAVVALAGLVNPYGFRLYQHVWQYLTDSRLLSRIGEFQSFTRQRLPCTRSGGHHQRTPGIACFQPLC